MHVHFLKSLIVMSGRFVSIFLVVRTAKAHSTITCFLLPIVRVGVCTIFLYVASVNAFIVSSVCTWLFDHVSVIILCFLLLGMLI